MGQTRTLRTGVGEPRNVESESMIVRVVACRQRLEGRRYTVSYTLTEEATGPLSDAGVCEVVAEAGSGRAAVREDGNQILWHRYKYAAG